MERMIVPSGLVWFTIVKLAVGPCQAGRGWLQIVSVLTEPDAGWGACTCCVNVGKAVGSATPGCVMVVGVPCGVPRPGNGGTVFVGTAAVGLGASVGGMGVAVGMACWVSATIVKAAACAVF